MASPEPATVDAYIDGFPDEIASRLREVRDAILVEVPDGEQRIRYGIAAVMFGGHCAVHFAGWRKHIGLYPVPRLPEPFESEIAPRRSGQDSVVFLHSDPLPAELISRICRAILAQRDEDERGD